MKSIVNDMLKFYGEITSGRLRWVSRSLHALDVSIITDFLENIRLMKAFYRRYVEPCRPRIVICGINPGRFGSGKVGIPFLDFRALNELVGDTGRLDSEKSARFFYSVVKHFRPERFYSTFYVTNVSCLGFIRDGRNVNYYRLPEDVRDVLLEHFTREMKRVAPTRIFPTSREVERTLASMKASGRIRADIGPRLPHPRWCGIDRNRAEGFREYVDRLGPFIRPGIRK